MEEEELQVRSPGSEEEEEQMERLLVAEEWRRGILLEQVMLVECQPQ